ncbi:MAG: hypothetical protein GY929_11990 [Actinomycetia bacterium]|nr:hypothetical protein [Actinomycetes bacterium]
MRPAWAAGVVGAALVAGLAVGLVSGASGSGGSEAGLVASPSPPGTAHIVTLPATTTSTTATTTSTTTTTIRLNELPVIEELTGVAAGLNARISASMFDPDGAVVLAEVRWGDGQTDEVTGPLETIDLTHRYQTGGDHRVIVVVHDDRQAGAVDRLVVTTEAVQWVEVKKFTLTSMNDCDRFSDDNEFVISIQLLDDGRRELLPDDPNFFDRRTMKSGDSVDIWLDWHTEIRPGAGSDLVFHLVESDSFIEGDKEELGPWRFDLDWPAAGINSGLVIEGGGCEAELWPEVLITEPELESASAEE